MTEPVWEDEFLKLIDDLETIGNEGCNTISVPLGKLSKNNILMWLSADPTEAIHTMGKLNWTATGDEDAPIWKAETDAGTYRAGVEIDSRFGFSAKFSPRGESAKKGWSWFGGTSHTAADAKAICEAIHAITQ